MTASDAPLIPAQRRERLMRLLRRDDILGVAQLADLLGVSPMTVRRDIAVLERDGRAYSVAGGVRIASGLHDEPSFAAKVVAERPQKAAIARAAEQWLHDGQTVYVDAGTTTGALIPAILERRRMTVVTNDFEVMSRLTSAEHIEAIHTGGRLDHTNRSAVGRLAADTLRRTHSDIAFMSTNSWDLHRGVTTPSEDKVDLKLAAMAGAAEAVLMVTSSKYGTFGLYDVAGLERYGHIVTDHRLPAAAARGIRDRGIALTLADASVAIAAEPRPR